MKQWFKKYKSEIMFYLNLMVFLIWVVGSITLCIIGVIYIAKDKPPIGVPCLLTGFLMLFIPFLLFILLKVVGYEFDW